MRDGAAAMARRGWLVGGLGLVGALTACVHLIDPATAANTDIGLQVYVTVTPTELRISDTTSYIRIRVTAKNPGSDTVRVVNGGPACDKTPDPIDGTGLLWSMRIADESHVVDAGPGGDVCGMIPLTFLPKKPRSFDFFVSAKSWQASGFPIVAKEYRARSFFAGYEGYSALFRVVP
jgi:hypothetical protein